MSRARRWQAVWYRNPRDAGGPWERFVAFAAVDNESPLLVDLVQLFRVARER